jgi:molybdopterin-guanine dinucleotide biosynthesis protein MobB
MAIGDASMPVLAVCGYSGSGKTTLLESVIPRLVERGLRVSAVKHDAHGFSVDRPGKDSDRLYLAGADVVLQSTDESVQRWHGASASDLDRLLATLAARSDVVLVEGHRSTPLPKLWLLAGGDTEPPTDTESVVEVLGLSDRRAEIAERIAADMVARAWQRRPVLGGVLIGGGSRRMGRPKQLLEHRGKSLVERAAEALTAAVDRVVLLGEGEIPDALAGLHRLPDPPGLTGPVAGLLAGQRWCPEAAWLMVPCDLPLITEEAVRWLLGQRACGRWAVLPRPVGGRVEPLFAVYEPQARELLESLVAGGRPAPKLLADDPKVVCPEPPPSLAVQWTGVNTPKQYRALGEGPMP